MADIFEIAGRIHSTSQEKVAVVADEVLDTNKKRKQSQVNAETDTALSNRYTKSETYNKTELNQMVAPQHAYITVATYADLANISEHPVGCVYRVSNYDGVNSQVDATKYSEYGWDGTQYVHLATKSQIGEVFDVSEYNATGGTLATYASLDALLSDANLSTIIPVGVRKGGMSIKFVQSNDKKYVQYFLTKEDFTTDVSCWQKINIEDVLTGSETKNITWSNGQITATGVIAAAGTIQFSQPISLVKGESVTVTTKFNAAAYTVIGTTASNSVAIGDTITPICKIATANTKETHTFVAYKDMKVVISVLKADYTVTFNSGNGVVETVGKLPEETDFMMGGTIDLTKYNRFPGSVNNTKWYVANGYEHVVIPISGKYLFKGTTSNISISFAFLTDYSIPANNDTVPLCSEGGIVPIPAGKVVYAQTPADAKYLVVSVKSGGTEINPEISVVGVDYLVGNVSAFNEMKEGLFEKTLDEKNLSLTYPSSATTTYDINVDIAAGEIIELSITGNDGILTSSAVQYFQDITNRIYFPSVKYNEVLRVQLTKATSKIRTSIGSTRVTASGTITITCKTVKMKEVLEEACADVKNLLPRVEALDEEAYEFALPGYYFENNYIQNKVARINELCCQSNSDGDVFMFITDIHWNSLNAHKSPNLLNYIRKNTNVSKMFSGGDICQSSGANYNTMHEATDKLRRAWNGETIFAVGNHEPDILGANANSLIDYCYNNERNDYHGNIEKLYYYFDNYLRKVRYVILNFDLNGGYTDVEQQTWFANEALNVESGWKVFIFVHWFCGWNGTWPDGDANYGDTISGGVKVFADAIKAVNADSGKGDVVAILQGHWHFDRVRFISNGVPMIIEAADKYYGTEVPSGTRVPNTITEQSFDAVITDFANELIYMVRIGGLVRDGIDDSNPVEERHISYAVNNVSIGSSITISSGLAGNITWNSNDTDIASVDSSGVVTGVAAGTAIITARDTTNKITYSCLVKVE